MAAAREARGVTHSDAASVTNIKVQHIEAIERDDFSPFAAPAYAKGFIRIYADYLGLDSGPLVKQYTAAHDAPVPPRLLKPEEQEAPKPSPPAEKETESPSQPKPGPNFGSFVRIALPVAGIVVLVIIVTKLFGGKGVADNNSPADGPSSEAGEPLRIGEPPAPYLDSSEAP